MKPLNPLVLPKNISFKTTDKESDGADKPIQTLLYRMYIAGRGKISQKELDAVFRKAVGGTVANTQGYPYLPDATPAQLWDAMTPKQRKANGMHLHILKALGEWATGRISGPLGVEDYFKVEKGRWEVDKDAAETLCSHSFATLPKTLKAIFTNTDIRYLDKKKRKKSIITLLDHKWGDDDQSLNIKGYQNYLKQIKRFERLRDLAMEQYLLHIEATLKQWTQKHEALEAEDSTTASYYFIKGLLSSTEVGFLFQGDPGAGTLGISTKQVFLAQNAPNGSINDELFNIADNYIASNNVIRMEPPPFGQQQLDELETKKDHLASIQLDSPLSQNSHLILVDGKPLKIKEDYIIHCPNPEEAIYIARTLAFAHDADTMVIRLNDELKVVIVEEAAPLIKGDEKEINARLRRVVMQRKNIRAPLNKNAPKKAKVEILRLFASDSDFSPLHHKSVSHIRIAPSTGNNPILNDIFEKKARIAQENPGFLERTWRFLGTQATNLKWFLSETIFDAPRPDQSAIFLNDNPYALTPEQQQRYQNAVDKDISLYYKNIKVFFEKSIGENISQGPLTSTRFAQLTEKLEKKVEQHENTMELAIRKIDASKYALLHGRHIDLRDAADAHTQALSNNLSSLQQWYLAPLSFDDNPETDLRMKTALVDYWIHQTGMLFDGTKKIDPEDRHEAVREIIQDTPLYLWPAKHVQILNLQEAGKGKETELEGMIILLLSIAAHERTLEIVPLKIHRALTALEDYINPWKAILKNSGELSVDINALCSMHYNIKIDDMYAKLTSNEYQETIDKIAFLLSDPSFGDHKEKLKAMADQLESIVDKAEEHHFAHLGPEQSLYALKRHTEVLRKAQKALRKAYRHVNVVPITEQDKENLRHAVTGLYTVLFYTKEWATLELEPALHYDLTKFTGVLRSFLDLFLASAEPYGDTHWLQEILVFIKSLDDDIILRLFDCWGQLFQDVAENQGVFDPEQKRHQDHLQNLIFLLEDIDTRFSSTLNIAQLQSLQQWTVFLNALQRGEEPSESPQTWEDNAARILNAEPLSFMKAKRLRKNIYDILKNLAQDSRNHLYQNNPQKYPKWLVALNRALTPAAKGKKAGSLYWQLSPWADQAAFQLYSAHAELKWIYQAFLDDPSTKNMSVQRRELQNCWFALDKAVGHLFGERSQPTIQQQVTLAASFGGLIEQFQLIFDASIIDSTSTINDFLRKFTGFVGKSAMGDGTNALEMQQMMMLYLGVYYAVMRKVISGEIDPDTIYAVLSANGQHEPQEVKDAMKWSDLYAEELPKAVSILVEQILLRENSALDQTLKGWGIDPLNIDIQEAVYNMQEAVGPTLLYDDLNGDSQPTDFWWLEGSSRVAQPQNFFGSKGAIQEALKKPDHPIYIAIDYAKDVGAMAAQKFRKARNVLDPNVATISIEEMNRSEKSLQSWCNALYQLDDAENDSLHYALLTTNGIENAPNVDREISIYHKAHKGVQNKNEFKINNTIDIVQRIANGYADVEKNLCGALTAVSLLGDGEGLDPTKTQLILPGTTPQNELQDLIDSGQFHYYKEIETIQGPIYYFVRIHEPKDVQSSVLKIIEDIEKLEHEIDQLSLQLESKKHPKEERDKILLKLAKKNEQWSEHPWAQLTSDRRQWIKETFSDDAFLSKIKSEKIWRQALSFASLFTEVFISALSSYRLAGKTIVPLAARTGLPATRGVMFALARLIDSVGFTTIHTLFDGHWSPGRYLHDIFVNFILVVNGVFWDKVCTKATKEALQEATLKGFDRASIEALKATLKRQGLMAEGMVVLMTTLILGTLGYLEHWIRHNQHLDTEQTVQMYLENFFFVLGLHLANRGRTNAAFDYDQARIQELTDEYIGQLQTLYRTRSSYKEDFAKTVEAFNGKIKQYIGDDQGQAALLLRNGISTLPMQGEMIGIWHRVKPALEAALPTPYKLASPWKTTQPAKKKTDSTNLTAIPPVSNGFKITFPKWVKKGTKILLEKLFGELATGIAELGEQATWLRDLYNDVIRLQEEFDASTTYEDLVSTRDMFNETLANIDTQYRELVKNDVTALALWSLAFKLLRSSFDEAYQKSYGRIALQYAKYFEDFEESSLLIEEQLESLSIHQLNENLSPESVADLRQQYESIFAKLNEKTRLKPDHIHEDAWVNALKMTRERYEIILWYYEQFAVKLDEVRAQQKRIEKLADEIIDSPNLSDSNLREAYRQLEAGTIETPGELLALLESVELALIALKAAEIPILYASNSHEYYYAIDVIARRFKILAEQERQRLLNDDPKKAKEETKKAEETVGRQESKNNKKIDKQQQQSAYQASSQGLPVGHPLLQILTLDASTPLSEAFVRLALEFWPMDQSSPNFHVLNQPEFAPIVFESSPEDGSSTYSHLILVTPIDHTPATYIRVTQGYNAGYALHVAHTILQGFGYQSTLSGPSIYTFNHTIQIETRPYSSLTSELPARDVAKKLQSLGSQAPELLEYVVSEINTTFSADNLPFTISVSDLYFNCPLNQAQQALSNAINYRAKGEDANAVLPHIMPYLRISLQPDNAALSTWFSSPQIQAEAFWQSAAGQFITRHIHSLSICDQSTLSETLSLSIEAIGRFNTRGTSEEQAQVENLIIDEVRARFHERQKRIELSNQQHTQTSDFAAHPWVSQGVETVSGRFGNLLQEPQLQGVLFESTPIALATVARLAHRHQVLLSPSSPSQIATADYLIIQINPKQSLAIFADESTAHAYHRAMGNVEFDGFGPAVTTEPAPWNCLTKPPATGNLPHFFVHDSLHTTALENTQPYWGLRPDQQANVYAALGTLNGLITSAMTQPGDYRPNFNTKDIRIEAQDPNSYALVPDILTTWNKADQPLLSNLLRALKNDGLSIHYQTKLRKEVDLTTSNRVWPAIDKDHPLYRFLHTDGPLEDGCSPEFMKFWEEAQPEFAKQIFDVATVVDIADRHGVLFTDPRNRVTIGIQVNSYACLIFDLNITSHSQRAPVRTLAHNELGKHYYKGFDVYPAFSKFAIADSYPSVSAPFPRYSFLLGQLTNQKGGAYGVSLLQSRVGNNVGYSDLVRAFVREHPTLVKPFRHIMSLFEQHCSYRLQSYKTKSAYYSNSSDLFIAPENLSLAIDILYKIIAGDSELGISPIRTTDSQLSNTHLIALAEVFEVFPSVNWYSAQPHHWGEKSDTPLPGEVVHALLNPTPPVYRDKKKTPQTEQKTTKNSNTNILTSGSQVKVKGVPTDVIFHFEHTTPKEKEKIYNRKGDNRINLKFAGAEVAETGKVLKNVPLIAILQQAAHQALIHDANSVELFINKKNKESYLRELNSHPTLRTYWKQYPDKKGIYLRLDFKAAPNNVQKTVVDYAISQLILEIGSKDIDAKVLQNTFQWWSLIAQHCPIESTIDTAIATQSALPYTQETFSKDGKRWWDAFYKMPAPYALQSKEKNYLTALESEHTPTFGELVTHHGEMQRHANSYLKPDNYWWEARASIKQDKDFLGKPIYKADLDLIDTGLWISDGQNFYSDLLNQIIIKARKTGLSELNVRIHSKHHQGLFEEARNRGFTIENNTIHIDVPNPIRVRRAATEYTPLISENKKVTDVRKTHGNDLPKGLEQMNLARETFQQMIAGSGATVEGRALLTQEKGQDIFLVDVFSAELKVEPFLDYIRRWVTRYSHIKEIKVHIRIWHGGKIIRAKEVNGWTAKATQHNDAHWIDYTGFINIEQSLIRINPIFHGIVTFKAKATPEKAVKPPREPRPEYEDQEPLGYLCRIDFHDWLVRERYADIKKSQYTKANRIISSKNKQWFNKVRVTQKHGKLLIDVMEQIEGADALLDIFITYAKDRKIKNINVAFHYPLSDALANHWVPLKSRYIKKGFNYNSRADQEDIVTYKRFGQKMTEEEFNKLITQTPIAFELRKESVKTINSRAIVETKGEESILYVDADIESANKYYFTNTVSNAYKLGIDKIYLRFHSNNAELININSALLEYYGWIETEGATGSLRGYRNFYWDRSKLEERFATGYQIHKKEGENLQTFETRVHGDIAETLSKIDPGYQRNNNPNRKYPRPFGMRTLYHNETFYIDSYKMYQNLEHFGETLEHVETQVFALMQDGLKIDRIEFHNHDQHVTSVKLQRPKTFSRIRWENSSLSLWKQNKDSPHIYEMSFPEGESRPELKKWLQSFDFSVLPLGEMRSPQRHPLRFLSTRRFLYLVQQELRRQGVDTRDLIWILQLGDLLINRAEQMLKSTNTEEIKQAHGLRLLAQSINDLWYTQRMGRHRIGTDFVYEHPAGRLHHMSSNTPKFLKHILDLQAATEQKLIPHLESQGFNMPSANKLSLQAKRVRTALKVDADCRLSDAERIQFLRALSSYSKTDPNVTEIHLMLDPFQVLESLPAGWSYPEGDTGFLYYRAPR